MFGQGSHYQEPTCSGAATNWNTHFKSYCSSFTTTSGRSRPTPVRGPDHDDYPSATVLLCYNVSNDMDTHEHNLGADLLVQRLLRQLAARAVNEAGDVLVVAGADRLSAHPSTDCWRLRAKALRHHPACCTGYANTPWTRSAPANGGRVWVPVRQSTGRPPSAQKPHRATSWSSAHNTQPHMHTTRGTNRNVSQERGRERLSSTFGAAVLSRSQNVGQSQSEGSSTSETYPPATAETPSGSMSSHWNRSKCRLYPRQHYSSSNWQTRQQYSSTATRPSRCTRNSAEWSYCLSQPVLPEPPWPLGVGPRLAGSLGLAERSGNPALGVCDGGLGHADEVNALI